MEKSQTKVTHAREKKLCCRFCNGANTSRNSISFLSDPGVPGVRSMGPVVFMSLRDVVADLTDVTLVDEDTKSILTDNANRAIQGNQAMYVT